jgi:hypothetical protein
MDSGSRYSECRSLFRNQRARAVLLVLLVLAAATIACSSSEQLTNDAVKENAGRGTIDNPIPAGEWMSFKDGKVRATRMIKPASAQIKQMNMYNADPPVGADYVLVWFEFLCEKDRCNPQIDLDFFLIDSSGKQWSEPSFIVLDNNLDTQEALRDYTMKGWQAFEFPSNETVKAIRVKWGLVTGATLHTSPPLSQ